MSRQSNWYPFRSGPESGTTLSRVSVSYFPGWFPWLTAFILVVVPHPRVGLIVQHPKHTGLAPKVASLLGNNLERSQSLSNPLHRQSFSIHPVEHLPYNQRLLAYHFKQPHFVSGFVFRSIAIPIRTEAAEVLLSHFHLVLPPAPGPVQNQFPLELRETA